MFPKEDCIGRVSCNLLKWHMNFHSSSISFSSSFQTFWFPFPVCQPECAMSSKNVREFFFESFPRVFSELERCTSLKKELAIIFLSFYEAKLLTTKPGLALNICLTAWNEKKNSANKIFCQYPGLEKKNQMTPIVQILTKRKAKPFTLVDQRTVDKKFWVRKRGKNRISSKAFSRKPENMVPKLLTKIRLLVRLGLLRDQLFLGQASNWDQLVSR